LDKHIATLTQMYRDVFSWVTSQRLLVDMSEQSVMAQRILMLVLVKVTMDGSSVSTWSDVLRCVFGSEEPGLDLPADFPDELCSKITEQLSMLNKHSNFEDMLPYVFEGFEYVLLEQESARTKKKRTGIFYTPNDVVGYIVEQSLGTTISPINPPNCNAAYANPAGVGKDMR